MKVELSTGREIELMKERPILMKPEMVNAILEDGKTQTRRTKGLEDVNKEPEGWKTNGFGELGYKAKERYQGRPGATFMKFLPGEVLVCPQVCPFGKPGDRLWLRETWAIHPYCINDQKLPIYRATEESKELLEGVKWKPSIHMPRWASRITLEVTEVRVERLQDIKRKDAISEGIQRHGQCGAYFDYKAPYHPRCFHHNPIDSFRSLWESINGAGSWARNDWVWVIKFKRG